MLKTWDPLFQYLRVFEKSLRKRNYKFFFNFKRSFPQTKMPTRHEMMLRRVRCTAAVWLIRGPFHVSKQTIELLPRATARRCLRASLRVENPRLSAGSIISLSSSGNRGKKKHKVRRTPAENIHASR